MKIKACLLYLLNMLILVGCQHDDIDRVYKGSVNLPDISFDVEHWRDSVYRDSPLRMRHRDSKLKILAIGNSFTHNAAVYLPSMIKHLDSDSVCFAKLTRSGCSLGMHWTSHVADTPDYEMLFSDDGRWSVEDIGTIDAALTLIDWDIITIQQVSGLSGIYSSYQPFLDNLIMLFHETNPTARIAWHSTWPYRKGCTHTDFKKYSHDPEKMYNAIREASAIASEKTDITIPSTNLIWRMRQDYPEVEDGFSADGFHISDPNAFYALSSLWYEVLISPETGHSCMDMTVLPGDVEKVFVKRALEIVCDLTGKREESNTHDIW